MISLQSLSKYWQLDSNEHSDLYSHLLDLSQLNGTPFASSLLLFFISLHYSIEAMLFLRLNSACFELFELIGSRVSDQNHWIFFLLPHRCYPKIHQQNSTLWISYNTSLTTSLEKVLAAMSHGWITHSNYKGAIFLTALNHTTIS